MLPPYPPGMILNQRYRLVELVDQGESGRIYLATDQEQAGQTCALKELAPLYYDNRSLENFREEVGLLRRLHHPQIPRLQHYFVHQGRWFMVQDYVVGKTYQQLLDERQRQGFSFTEAEVMHLLLHLLPVLDYIHGQGIIHQDINPKNIMCREPDHLPVLVDFGDAPLRLSLVRKIARRLSSITGPSPSQLGYAPVEQIWVRRVYTHTDLYSLGVVALVLLSGKSPQLLLNHTTLTWKWQPYVRPPLGRILQRMSSFRLEERYPSAEAVLRALQLDCAGYTNLGLDTAESEVPSPSPRQAANPKG